MDREQINKIYSDYLNDCESEHDMEQIFTLAYKAIPSAEPKSGHWVEEKINEWSRKVFCSECGCPPPFEHVSNGDVYSASGYGRSNKTKYCPNCGARMFKQRESEEA